MSFDPKPFSEYVSTVEKTLATGHASEGSHYPTLKALLESVQHNLNTSTLQPPNIFANPISPINPKHLLKQVSSSFGEWCFP